MEATGHARWFERLLAELGFELWIGDPAKSKAKRVRKQKTDRLDAALLLLQLLLLEDRSPRVKGRRHARLPQIQEVGSANPTLPAERSSADQYR